MRLGIVASRFNEALAAPLLERARREAERLGAETSVPPLRGEMSKLQHKLVADVTLAPDQSSYRT